MKKFKREIPLSQVTQRRFIFGDFDNDGVKNIDDPYPYNKKKSSFPTDKKGYWTRSKYGGGEVKLSDELKAIENYNNRRSGLLRKFLADNPNARGRIKTVPSTIKKLRERYLKNVKDIAAAMILTKNRKRAYKKANEIKRRYKYDPDETDDYYKKPLLTHRAIHLGLFSARKPENRLEVQIKSKAMNKIDVLVHPYYKRGVRVPIKYQKKARRLFREGF